MATAKMRQKFNGRPFMPTFWGGGFDSPSPIARLNGRPIRLDLIAATEHDSRAAEDYALLARLGLGWSREDVRWHLCEPQPGRYDFSHLEPVVDAAKRHNIQIVWSWMHYGCPEFSNPLDVSFPDQLAALGVQHLRWLRQHEITDPIVCPINEISYYTWHVETLGNWYPFALGQGARLKANLIAGHRRCYEQSKEIVPEARILMIDPFYYAVGDARDPATLESAAFWREASWEAMDQLAAYSDILGMNFYPDSQVECYRDSGTNQDRRRMLPLDDPRRVSLTQALQFYHSRYGSKPVLVAETSIRGMRRVPWITRLTDEAIEAIRRDLPIVGICWYPVLDVWDWSYLRHGRVPSQPRFSRSGLIRLDHTGSGLRRSVSATLLQVMHTQGSRVHSIQPSVSA
jgi:hypothetical protein